MADFFFFTDIESLLGAQTEQQAFGPVPSQNNLSFRVNNQFLVSKNAPAIAVIDAIPFVQQCTENENCVNIILLPINNPDFDFPVIKFFVYRGVDKASLFDTSGTIKESDNTWKSNNILKVLYDLQNKINIDNGTTLKPKSENLGYHYSVSNNDNFQNNDTYLETIIFKKDTVQLPLIKAGCQIGKFIGDTIPAGFQIIQDRLGYEPTLGQIRKSDHIVTVDVLASSSKVDTFKHWHQKEAILTYIDPAAFYGCAHANNKKTKIYNGQSIENEDTANIINLFYNKEVVYLDIRNDQNYSYDYYDNFGKQIRLSFEQEGSDEFLVEEVNYYEDWPLLRLKNKVLPIKNATSKIVFELPFKGIGDDVTRFYLNSFTHDFLPEGNPKTKFHSLNELDADSFRVKYADKITLRNWVNKNNILGANYFVFKYSLLQSSFSENILRNTMLDALFSLDMKFLIGDDNLDDGDFKTYVYSSINAPIIDKRFGADDSQDVYLPTIGIAKDKDHITFFAFRDRVYFNGAGDNLNYPFSLIKEGEYDNSVHLDEFNYDPNQKSLGFLAALPLRLSSQNLKLKKITHKFPLSGSSLETEDREYLYYLNTKPIKPSQFYIDPRTFDCITITNQEYDTLLALKKSEFNPAYRCHLSIVETATYNNKAYQIQDLKLGLKQVAPNNTSGLITYKLEFIKDIGSQLELNGLITKS